ncbi:MAG: hypothetical protein ACYC96_12335 [Fimbriimonadaceae bacterium]
MALPDPNVPIQGSRVLIIGAIGCIAFTIAMAVLTYAGALGWAALHHQPAPLPPPSAQRAPKE